MSYGSPINFICYSLYKLKAAAYHIGVPRATLKIPNVMTVVMEKVPRFVFFIIASGAEM
jgi:hypothetical protein